MRCEKDELRIRYSAKWKYHVFEVVTVIDGVQDVYHHSYLKHAQEKVICGNRVEFHRYFSGINLKVTDVRNPHFDGLFNDSRCLP